MRTIAKHGFWLFAVVFAGAAAVTIAFGACGQSPPAAPNTTAIDCVALMGVPTPSPLTPLAALPRSGVPRDKLIGELTDAELGRLVDFEACLSLNGYLHDCCSENYCMPVLPTEPPIGPFHLETVPLIASLVTTCTRSTEAESGDPSREATMQLYRKQFGACHAGLWEDCDREGTLGLLGLGSSNYACLEKDLECTEAFDAGSPTDADAPAVLTGATDDAGSGWIDCVVPLHVTQVRAYGAANAYRFGESTPGLRTSSRVSDLSPADIRAFCDWETCIRTNGYAHFCWVNDAGVEQCRVCDGGADCNGLPMSEDDCVAHATDPTRAPCHVGLMEECLIQKAVRGYADPRVTQACALAAQACAGQLPGDLAAQETAAEHETDQVTIEECDREVAVAAQLAPDSSAVGYWQTVLAQWDGGLPPPLDASAVDADAADGDGSDSD